jgi:hypothetical protein
MYDIKGSIFFNYWIITFGNYVGGNVGKTSDGVY